MEYKEGHLKMRLFSSLGLRWGISKGFELRSPLLGGYCPLLAPRCWLEEPKRRAESGLHVELTEHIPAGLEEEVPVVTSGRERVCIARVRAETPTKSNRAAAGLKHIISEE